MRTILATLVFVLVANVATAQSTVTVAWDYAGITAAQAQSFGHTLSVDGVVQPGVPACSGSAPVTCQQVIPKPTAGRRTFVVTSLQDGVQVGTSKTIDADSGVHPQRIRITTTTIVEISN